MAKQIKLSEYFLMFVLLCASGNPIFGFLLGSYGYIIVLVASFLFYNRSYIKASKQIFQWCFVFFLIFLGHYIILPSFSLQGSLNYLAKVIIAIGAAYIFKKKFPLVYLRVITISTLISLILWLGNISGIDWPGINLSDRLSSLFIYSQPTQYAYNSLLWGFHRNYGMFWEPGAFAGYILIAFFLFINQLNFLWKYYRLNCLILMAGLLSTFSTTGYIVLGVIIMYFLYSKVKNKFALAILGSIFMILFSYTINSLDFMGEKISAEFDHAQNMDEYDYSSSRTGSLVMDWQYIKMHPIVGNGLLNETRFSRHLDIVREGGLGVGNGFSGEIAYFGIPFMIFYLMAIYRNRTLKWKWGLLLVVILLLQGEYYMNYPIYFIFPFVSFFNTDDKQKCVNYNTSKA